MRYGSLSGSKSSQEDDVSQVLHQPFARSLSTTDNRFTFSRIADVRKEYYENLVINNPQNAKFLTGWLNRVDRCSQVTFE
ncbi:putative peptidoglycan-binding domain-containing protein [Cronobacter muytjensii]|nr:putative peptidoglycan-binding domain-containing protein [Cronobacter muytjensii]